MVRGAGRTMDPSEETVTGQNLTSVYTNGSLPSVYTNGSLPSHLYTNGSLPSHLTTSLLSLYQWVVPGLIALAAGFYKTSCLSV